MFVYTVAAHMPAYTLALAGIFPHSPAIVVLIALLAAYSLLSRHRRTYRHPRMHFPRSPAIATLLALIADNFPALVISPILPHL
jgi:hypothetical protein